MKYARRKLSNIRSLLPAVLLLTMAIVAGGCSDESALPPASDLIEEGSRLEQDGVYYQVGSRSGALEAYSQALEQLQAQGGSQEQIEELKIKVDWLNALRFMTEEKFLQKADYPAAIASLTAFSERYPDHPDALLAIFFRGVAHMYDVDFQNPEQAIADFETFIDRAGNHPMVAEAMYQIGHVREFSLAKPDYSGAIEAYSRAIETFGPTDEKYSAAPDVVKMAVERSLFNRARLLEKLGDVAEAPELARSFFQRATSDYRRLVAGAPPAHGRPDDVFFESARFPRYQYVYYRLGSVLADELGRKEEGIAVLRNMQKRWPDSPWFGRVEAKVEYILGQSPTAPAPVTVEQAVQPRQENQ